MSSNVMDARRCSGIRRHEYPKILSRSVVPVILPAPTVLADLWPGARWALVAKSDLTTFWVNDQGAAYSYRQLDDGNWNIFLHEYERRGYKRMALSGGVRVDIHKLVAKAFVAGYKPGLTVNHKSGIKSDNRAANLEWITHAANVAHAAHMGLMPWGERSWSHKLTAVQVINIRHAKGSATQRELGSLYGVHPSHISRLQGGEMWKRIQ